MDYLWIIGELAAIAAICGLIAGSAPDRAKLTRNFLWLALIGAGMALILAAVTRYQVKMITDLFQFWSDQQHRRYEANSSFEVWWITSYFGKIPGYAIWSATALAVWLVWGAGLVAFNCRCAVKSWWIALAGVAAGAAIVYYLCFLGAAGLGALIVLFGRFHVAASLEVALAAAVIANTLLLLGWTLYSFFGKYKGWRVLVSQLGIWAGCYLLCWGGAFVLSSAYAKWVKSQAVKQGVVPYRVIFSPSLPEIAGEIQKISHFYRDHQLFSLPVDGLHAWRKRRYDQQSMVSAKTREYTLQFFDSPEMMAYYQYYDNILNAEIPPGALDSMQIVYLWCYAEVYAGRAALYLERGEPDKILPELLKIMPMDQQKLTGKPYLQAEYTHIGCCVMMYTYLVSLGPDGPQYAPYYRQALDYLKAQKVSLPDGAGVYLDQLERLKPASCYEFLVMPGAMAHLAKGVAYFTSIRPEIQKLADDGYHGQSLPWDSLDIYQQLARFSEISLLLGRTGLALKLYRSEEGKYPATLAELVPKYLDQIPVSPLPDAPLIYRLEGNDFWLTIQAPSSKYPYKTTTEKQY